MNAVSPLEIFRAQGVPHRRVEDWKYSDLRAVLDAEIVEHPFGVVMVISHPSPQIETVINDDLPDWASSGVQSLGIGGAMEAAARAFSPNVAAIRVPIGLQVAEPLRIEFHADGQGQIILRLEKGASLTLIETHHGDSEALRNVSLSIILENDATLTHIRREHFAKTSVAVETIGILADRGAHYRGHFASLGARLSRTELNVMLVGEGADADLSGVSVLGDGAHADVTTRIDHSNGPHAEHATVQEGRRREVSRRLSGQDHRQRRRRWLRQPPDRQRRCCWAPRAEADLKPELEIFADDVKCAHGAAVGDLDVESLFYLRSRGIPEPEARALLIRAFLEEAVDGIADESVRADTWQLRRAGPCARHGANAMTAQPKTIKADFDPVAARADFPILSREVYGKPLVYLDNAASAQKPQQVLDAMARFATSEYANVHRGVHFLSAAATDRYEAARETVRKFLNAAHEDEIVFTKGGTEAINLVA